MHVISVVKIDFNVNIIPKIHAIQRKSKIINLHALASFLHLKVVNFL